MGLTARGSPELSFAVGGTGAGAVAVLELSEVIVNVASDCGG